MKQRWISVVVAVLLATQGSIPARAQTMDAIPAVTPGTAVPETPAEAPAAHPSTHRPSHADSLAFWRVSGSVGPRTQMRVLSAKGSFGARGSEVTWQGIRRGAVPGEPGESGLELVPWSEIERVQTCQSGAGRGAAVGAGVFGVLGLGLGVVISNVEFGFGSNDDTGVPEVAALTLVSATVGALLGALIGAPATRWRTVHSWAGF
jgi:hypothetical protein